MLPGKSPRQAQRESHVNCIKMASNENPFGPSPKAVLAMQAVLAESNYYPDNDAIELRQKLAERHNVRPEQIVPTAGSTALLGIIVLGVVLDFWWKRVRADRAKRVPVTS